MQNIYAPERQAGETQKQYRERLAKTRKSVAGRRIDPRTLGKGPSSTDRERAAAKAKRPAPTQPKFAKARKHKQHVPALRDEHGAYTLTGSTYEVVAAEGESVTPTTGEHVFGGTFGNGGHTDYVARRKWLAGISAQRGY